MSDNEPVCECGCPLTRHVRVINGVLACAAGCPSTCEQFTDARLAALRARIGELEGKNNDLATLNEYWIKRANYSESQLKQRDIEIARLTPTETNVPPTKPGWYWRVNDEIDEWEVVHVRKDLDGNLYTESRDDDETVVINLVLHGERWSKEPIPEMPEIEKEPTND